MSHVRLYSIRNYVIYREIPRKFMGISLYIIFMIMDNGWDIKLCIASLVTSKKLDVFIFSIPRENNFGR